MKNYWTKITETPEIVIAADDYNEAVICQERAEVNQCRTSAARVAVIDYLSLAGETIKEKCESICNTISELADSVEMSTGCRPNFILTCPEIVAVLEVGLPEFVPAVTDKKYGVIHCGTFNKFALYKDMLYPIQILLGYNPEIDKVYPCCKFISPEFYTRINVKNFLKGL